MDFIKKLLSFSKFDTILAFQLPLLLWSLLSFLLSEPHTQLDVTLLLLPIGPGAAAAAPHVFTVFLATTFQALWYYFGRCWSEWRKIW